jgi:putative aldouronate transport system substrate-binding protein
MKEALAFGAQIISEDLGSPNFAVTGYNQDELISAGKGGIFTAVSSGAAAMLKNIQAENPDGHIAVVEMPKAPGIAKGVSSYANTSGIREGHPMGIQCLTMLNADFPAEKIDQLTKFIDWHFTEEGNLVQTYGIEGETYEMRDGKPYILEAFQNDPLYLRQKGAWDVYLYAGYITQLDNWNQLWAPEAAQNMYNTMLMSVQKVVYFNTATGDTHGNEMNSKREEIFRQIILGTIGLDEGWDLWMSEWKRIGGENWTTEMNERYHQMKK